MRDEKGMGGYQAFFVDEMKNLRKKIKMIRDSDRHPLYIAFGHKEKCFEEEIIVLMSCITSLFRFEAC